VELLHRFKLRELTEQQRCLDDTHRRWLDKLRAGDTVGLSGYIAAHLLTPQDFVDDPSWATAPIAVPGNPERHAINHEMLARFAAATGVPIVTWPLVVHEARGKTRGGSRGLDVRRSISSLGRAVGGNDGLARVEAENRHVLTFSYVEGAPCVLNANAAGNPHNRPSWGPGGTIVCPSVRLSAIFPPSSARSASPAARTCPDALPCVHPSCRKNSRLNRPTATRAMTQNVHSARSEIHKSAPACSLGLSILPGARGDNKLQGKGITSPSTPPVPHRSTLTSRAPCCSPCTALHF